MAQTQTISDDIEVKVATNAAQEFVESYYPSLNHQGGRAKLNTFYAKPTPTSKVDISMNGIVVPDPEALKAIFQKDIEKIHYEVQSFDCHVINNNYTIGAPEGLGLDKDGKNISLVVIVNGSVKYFAEGEDGDVRGFTDNVILVPNWEARGPKASKGVNRWLIQNQTFRLVL